VEVEAVAARLSVVVDGGAHPLKVLGDVKAADCLKSAKTSPAWLPTGWGLAQDQRLLVGVQVAAPAGCATNHHQPSGCGTNHRLVGCAQMVGCARGATKPSQHEPLDGKRADRAGAERQRRQTRRPRWPTGR
jgi:hypothetical protein